MKLSLFTTGLALVSSAIASTSFRIRIGNAQNPDLNGLYVQSLNGVATLGPPFIDITASFSDPAITTDSTLLFTEVPGSVTGKIMLAPSMGVERIVFADVPPPNARFTEWSLIKSATTSSLTYGTGADRFVVYSPPSSIAHYEIYWVPQGAAFPSGSEVDLIVEWI